MTPTRRRWFRCSLRTIFVGLTLVCCWLGYEIRPVRSRAGMLVWCGSHGGDVEIQNDLILQCPLARCFSGPPREIGWIRRRLGDRPVASMYFKPAPPLDQQRELIQLFPEADLAWWGEDNDLHDFSR
jgi:hypothetical protein